MPFRFLNKDIYKYANLTMALIGTFWFISLFELIMSKSIYTNLLLAIIFKFINDFWCGTIIGLTLFLIPYLCNLFLKKPVFTIVKVLFVILIIIQYALVKYSLTTLLNLGADLLGYSLDDIFNTVSASESFSITYFIPFIVFPLLFFFLFLQHHVVQINQM